MSASSLSENLPKNLSDQPLAVAILAAGKGTRMKSDLPKVLHKLGSQTIIERVVRTVIGLKPQRCLVIVGHGHEQVRSTLADYPVEFVEQIEQHGTGHAVQQVIPYLSEFQGNLLVTYGDAPLLREETLRSLLQIHQDRQPAVTLLTADVSNPYGYGRVFCDESDDLESDQGHRVLQIIEEKDCTPAQRQHTRINSGVYCFRWSDLAVALPKLVPSNQQQEYYLTDVISLVPSALAFNVEDIEEIRGINDRLQLAQAYDILQDRIKAHWMRAGVTLVDPSSITIDDTVHLDPDVVIEPQTHLRGTTVIQSGCHIGPGSLIENSRIAAYCQIRFSVVVDSDIGDHTTIGPYAHVRPQSQIADHCRIGNFVETKNATIGSHTNAAHLSYVGDAAVGSQVNIGAGTIFVNYDGVQKHHTQIGDRSKTGANSALVAPLNIGQGVTFAAGSTITEDLPDDCLAIARARQVIKPGWRQAGQSPTKSKGSESSPPLISPVKIYALRLNPDQDLRQSLVQFSLDRQIQAGFIMTAVGSLKTAALRFADQEQTEMLEACFEIVSLSGSICLTGVHLHLAIADPTGKTLGGHLGMGCLVRTTVEIVIGDSLEHRFSRVLDPITGYPELVVSQKKE